jgi:hypothetical protein
MNLDVQSHESFNPGWGQAPQWPLGKSAEKEMWTELKFQLVMGEET